MTAVFLLQILSRLPVMTSFISTMLFMIMSFDASKGTDCHEETARLSTGSEKYG